MQKTHRVANKWIQKDPQWDTLQLNRQTLETYKYTHKEQEPSPPIFFFKAACYI